MRILVIGAGAIGGLLADRLCRAGHELAVVARGAHLEALRKSGLTVEADGRATHTRPAAFASVDEAGAADAVFVTLKSHQLAPMASELGRAAAGARHVVSVQNGIPWWYFQGVEGPHAGRSIRAVDAEGMLVRELPAARTAAAFAFLSAEVVAPGCVRYASTGSDSFPVGAVQDGNGAQAEAAAALLREAKFDAPVVDPRLWMWNKLLGNAWANPIGALTRATVGATATHPASRGLALSLMREVAAVATAFGYATSIDFELRLARAAQRADARASMLQDVERGRRTEHEAILGALVELAELAGIPLPHSATLLACLRLAAAVHVDSAAPGGE